MEIRRMWENGPLRQWSATKHGRWIPSANGGYSGSYVCDHCRHPVVGVYRQTWPNVGVQDCQNWFCASCRSELRPKQVQPAQLRQQAKS